MTPRTPFVFPLASQHMEQQSAWWHGAFSNEELDGLEKFCDALPRKDGTTPFASEGEKLRQVRRSKVAWVYHTSETVWLYQRLMEVVQELNAQYFGFDLWGIVDPVQYTVYDEEGSHYDWHCDIMNCETGSPRKLSVSLQLSDPAAYEGGELEVWGVGGAHQVREEARAYRIVSVLCTAPREPSASGCAKVARRLDRWPAFSLI